MEAFLPYGVQYYRAPTPHADDWERDLRSISCAGFNTVKLWVQWRWNNPARDRFDFSDIDRLMDLCSKYRLTVVLNVIYDVAPSWLFVRRPDCRMITADGRRVEPTTHASRQIGGLPGPCYNHAEARELRKRFTTAAVTRYHDHPALAIWDLWNEPELRRGSQPRDLVCYCDSCRAAFIDWLIAKYETLATLNLVWSKRYGSWEELELPRNGGAIKDMVDWRLFFGHILTRELHERVAAVRTIDTTHPVMVHPAYFDKISGCWDGQAMADACDLFGGSTGADPYYATVYASYAGTKQVISSEVHAYGGYTLDRGTPPNFATFATAILTPLAYGYTGFLYWQYRPERAGRESPMWGLTRPDGSATPWLGYAARLGEVLARYERTILHGRRVPVRVGIISEIKNHLFSWCAAYTPELHEASLKGAFELFDDLGVRTSMVDGERVRAGDLSDYAVLYYPFPYYTDAAAAAALEQWVADGGVLIAEAFFGGYNDDTGLHNAVLPGFGFDEVFGVREGHSSSAGVFGGAYQDDAADDRAVSQPVQIELDGGGVITGRELSVAIEPTHASILGRFTDAALAGSPAVSMVGYEKGTAYYIGTFVGAGYQARANPGTRKAVGEWLAAAGVEPSVKIVDPCSDDDRPVRLETIADDEVCLLIAHNRSGRRRTVSFLVLDGAVPASPSGAPASPVPAQRGASESARVLRNVFGETPDVVGRDGRFTITLEAKEATMFELRPSLRTGPDANAPGARPEGRQ